MGGSGSRRAVRCANQMRESPTELERVQQLLDHSIEQASPYLRSSFEMPQRSLSAEQLANRLQGSLTVALGTVTARGEPRVAPINALFVHGAFCVPTVAESARARHLRQRPGASLTYYEGVTLAVIAHGGAEIIDGLHPDFAELDELQVESGQQSPTQWHGQGVYLRLDARTLYTYAREPSKD
jgi:hypothetical protein